MKNQTQLSSNPAMHQSSRRLRCPRPSRRRLLFERFRRLVADSDFNLGASLVIRHSSLGLPRFLALITLLTLPTLFTGCTVTSYTSPCGEKFTRSSLGANTSLHSLAFEANTNGLRRVELHGYQNDSAQALGAVTEAAVRGAISAAKP